MSTGLNAFRAGCGALILLLAGGAATPTLAQPGGASGPATAADAARGKHIFYSVGCWECHGYAGQGGIQPMSGPRIARLGVPLEAFARFLRQPLMLMPPYEREALSDQDVADIRAYLDSLPAPRPATAIPMLNTGSK